MYEVFANNEVPKGTYICLNCQKEISFDQKEFLLPCEECGGEKFKANIILDLSHEEIKEKFNQCIEILCISVYLFEKLNYISFLNVIALNLRMLLCDGENSLLTRIYPDFKFAKCSGDYHDNVLLPEELFLNNSELLSLERFLEQVVIYRNLRKPITIKKMIRAVANKGGGAHLDVQIEEDYYLSANVSKFYLILIAKYIIEKAEISYDEKCTNFIKDVREKCLNIEL